MCKRRRSKLGRRRSRRRRNNWLLRRHARQPRLNERQLRNARQLRNEKLPRLQRDKLPSNVPQKLNATLLTKKRKAKTLSPQQNQQHSQKTTTPNSSSSSTKREKRTWPRSNCDKTKPSSAPSKPKPSKRRAMRLPPRRSVRKKRLLKGGFGLKLSACVRRAKCSKKLKRGGRGRLHALLWKNKKKKLGLRKQNAEKQRRKSKGGKWRKLRAWLLRQTVWQQRRRKL